MPANINFNPIERVIGGHDLIDRVERGRTTIINSPPLLLLACALVGRVAFVCPRVGGWRFRVDAFYMNTNIGPKVSNLTVGHHQYIPITFCFTTKFTNEQGAPLFMGTAPQFGDTLTPITS